MVWQPRVMVIGPGSSKVMKILGFLTVMESNGVLSHIDTYCGVGTGAIIVLLLSIGYTVKNIISIVATNNILHDIESYNGICEIGRTDIIRKKLTDLIIAKCGTIPSLSNLYLQTGMACNFITYDESSESECLLGPFHENSISCIDACLFSMNIPYIYYKLRHNGSVFVDGALANPYPIHYFDHDQTNILGIYTKSIPKPANILQTIEKREELYQWHIIIQCMIYQHVKHLITQSSEHCVHICIESDIDNLPYIDDTNSEKLSSMLVAGYNYGLEIVDAIKDGMYHSQIPTIDLYQYPQYYLEADS